MKKLLLASAATLLATQALAEDVKIGVLLGFTGPIESLVTAMGPAAHLAIKEVNDSGLLLGGSTVSAVNGDTTCVDSAAATAAAERLITADGINGIVGGDCSGVTGAILQNVARPNGMVMISPSATSPGLTSMEDDGLFFRTAPSDARQSEVMAGILKERGYDSVALTYSNTDYGKGIAESFIAAYEALGGTVTLDTAHEDGKADYTAEVGALAAAGGDVLVIAGFPDQGGGGVVRAALDLGAFDRFHFADGMSTKKMSDDFGADIDGSSGQHPSPPEELATAFVDLVGDGFDAATPFAPESYDAAALLLLAMQSAGSSDPADYKDHVFSVANAPGEKIGAGELAKGLKILADGGEIDYVGAAGIELIGPGEAKGTYREVGYDDGDYVTVKYH